MTTLLKNRFGRKPIGQVLVEKGLIKAEERDLVIKKSEKTGERVGQLLVDDGYINDIDLAKNIAEIYNLPFLDLSLEIPLDPAAIEITEKFSKENKLLLLSIDAQAIRVATNDPANVSYLTSLPQTSGKKIECVISPLSQIREKQKKYVSEPIAIPELRLAPTDPVDSQLNLEHIVRGVLDEALDVDASDIHIEPTPNRVRVRLRVHGILREHKEFPLDYHLPLIAKLKVLGNLDVAEKRIAQDGSFHFTNQSKSVDIRLSTMPSIMGEKAVLRILDRSVLKTKLEELGMTSDLANTLHALIAKPSGLLLLTGPTGCGKTTTVYSLIELFNKIEKNMITVEDPVEYRVDNITQVQVHAKAGITFPSALRSMLRQDPDVIIIGEIRDRETAEIAIRAALTGHLVISTLHTNDSLAAIHRLMDMGVEPYLIASSLIGILSQRLVRVLCPKCKREGKPTESQLKLLRSNQLNPESQVGYTGTGCKFCSQATFKNRMGIFEFLPSSSEIKELITLRKSAREIVAVVQARGFKSMRDDGIHKALAGLTTLDEVLRQTI